MDQLPGGQKPGLLTRILLGVGVLGLVIVAFFFLTVALIAGAIIALMIGVRLWWTVRKLKRDMASAAPMQGGTHDAGADTLDGEYQVVERESGGEKFPPKS